MIGIAFFFCALLFVPLWLGKIKPNAFYGYRTRLSAANDSNWYHMNKFSAQIFFPLFLGLAIASYFLSELSIVVMLFVGMVPLGVACWLEEKRLKKRDS